MDKQPEALRLADKLDQTCDYNTSVAQEASEELRRLHQVNQELVEAFKSLVNSYQRLKPIGYPLSDSEKQAQAAIAKHKEQS